MTDEPMSMMDLFAGSLARLDCPVRAAATLGKSPAWGLRKFREICAGLGVPTSREGDMAIDAGPWREH